MPPKKRKADEPAEDVTPKKKMTKKEKQDALERAHQSMQQPVQAARMPKAGAASAATPKKKPAAKKPAAKKPKADAPAEDATPKKKMTKKEKQEALERAHQSMQQPAQAARMPKAGAAAAATPKKKPAAKKPAAKRPAAIPAAKKPASSAKSKKSSQHEQLEEARAQAAEWAAEERARQNKTTQPSAASTGPSPSRPSSKAKAVKSKKKTKVELENGSPTVESKKPASKKKQQSKKQESNDSKKGDQNAPVKPKKSWKKVVFVLLLLSILSGAMWFVLRAAQQQEEDSISTSAQLDQVQKTPDVEQQDVTKELDQVQKTPDVEQKDVPKEQLQEWQSCKVFLAPSTLPGVDWGVFAAVDFEENDVVEIEPLLIAFNWDEPIARFTVLDDYGFSYVRRVVEGEQEHFKSMSAVIFGYMMAYNHHPSEPNVENRRFGDEPSEQNPNSSLFMGMVAKRHISAGEELFTTYGQDDGGAVWFQSRRLPLETLPQSETRLNESDLVNAMQKHCPKLYAGPSESTWWDRVEVGHERPAESSRFPPNDAGIGNVMARVDMSPGDVIESVPALTLHWDRVKDTALAPLSIGWNELEPHHREAVHSLRDAGKVELQHQGPDTDWKREDRWGGFGRLAILPASGGIGMVERVGNTPGAGDANCRLKIRGDDETPGSLVLDLIARKAIKAGEVLKLNLRAAGSRTEVTALSTELEKVGHPIGPNTAYLQSIGGDET